MKRVQNWLKKLVTTDYIEYNENASHETLAETNSTDKFDNEYGLLSDVKRLSHIERTSDEAHRLLPLFHSEIRHQMKQRNLLLTRLELDLYVM